MADSDKRIDIEQGDLFGIGKPVEPKPIKPQKAKKNTQGKKEESAPVVHPAPINHPIIVKAEQLHKRLNSLADEIHQLKIHENRKRIISFGRHDGLLVVRLHVAFLDAPDAVIKSLAAWIKRQDRHVPEVVRKFVDSIEHQKELPINKRLYHKTSAGVFDLKKLYDKVNNEFFKGKIAAEITWGRDSSRLRVQIRRLGSYSHEMKLITIHPLLDDTRVPEFVVSFTIYHEMLHALQPEGHRSPHDAAFRKAEQNYPLYKEVVAWQKKNAKFLCGGLRRK